MSFRRDLFGAGFAGESLKIRNVISFCLVRPALLKHGRLDSGFWRIYRIEVQNRKSLFELSRFAGMSRLRVNYRRLRLTVPPKYNTLNSSSPAANSLCR
jgi:hypothetical protein